MVARRRGRESGMNREIERRFLLRSDAWRMLVVGEIWIKDALLLSEQGAKLRLRIVGDDATLAFKGPRLGFTRQEYEYPIPISEAQEMMTTLSRGRILTKRRYFVPFAGMLWEIDHYDPPLQDVIVAEVELPEESYSLTLPDWVGEEVTGDPLWRKQTLLGRALASVTEASSA